MRFKLDSGPIMYSKTIAIAPDDTTETLRDRLNEEAIAVLPDVIRSLADGTATFTEQEDTQATKVGKLDKSIGDLDQYGSDSEKWNIFRAIGGRGWAHATISKDGQMIRAKITNAHLEDGAFAIDEIIPPNGKRQSYKS
jgi:methionyl-tRNA formyltransferase